jgi:CheY-like chemotaxis protein
VVRLPLGAVGAAPAGARVAAPAAGVGRCRILVVDDNADAVESLSILLGMRGHEVHTASDGREAVRLAGSLALDVVVLDIGLPGMDGFEAARRIRRLPGGAELVLIALTGWGQEDDRRRSREAGFDHHLVKPVDIDALERFIARRVPCAVPRAAGA